MISEEKIAQEFIQVVQRLYPTTGEVLNQCHLKIKNLYDKNNDRYSYYLIVYCANSVVPILQFQEKILKEIAENMGLIDVICVRAAHLISDPKSKLKEENPRLWLELHWIVSPH